jgi:hypothetical protein
MSQVTAEDATKRVCPVCNKEFPPKRWNSKYFQPKCVRAALHERNARRWREDPDVLLRIGVRAAQKAMATGDKAAARRAVNSLVATGDIRKAKRCAICGNTKNVELHHSDYFRPLDVVALCRACHRSFAKGKAELTRVA